MKSRKLMTFLLGAAMSVSLLAGCGQSVSQSGSADTAAETEADAAATGETQEAAAEAESAPQEEEEAASEAVSVSGDPIERITQGYYTYSYPVEGMDDMVCFFHFYEEQPVLGSVFYASYAWNQIVFAGTYTVEEAEHDYACYPDREAQTEEGAVPEEGTAPYTITFYDFDGNELDSCAYDGEVLYGDMETISGMGGENSRFLFDAQGEASPYYGTYEGEKGISYLDFVAEEEETSTLSLYHNATYMDLVNMMVEGSWTMEETEEGYAFTLTPESESDTGAILTVSADKMSAVYTPDGGEAVAMINASQSGPAAAMELTGTTPIPGQEIEADLIGKLYDDGTCVLSASAFGTEIELDAGTWEMAEDGYTVNFVFDKAGEISSTVGEGGAQIAYAQSGSPMGDVDAVLTISVVE